MLLNDGDLHRKHKNLCSPAFRPSNIRRLFPLVHNCCAHLVDYWKRRCDQSVEGVLVREDIRSHISRVTLSVIGLMAFGLDFDCIGDRRSQLSDHFEKIMAVTVVWRPWYVLPFSAYFPHPMMRNFWVGLKGLETSLANIVSWHGEQKSPLKAGRHGCLLEMILETSSKEPHQSSGECSLSPTELRDEMMTFLMAGHETSSLGLTWALYLLAKHPNIQQKCFEEARNFDRSTIDTDQNPLEQLKYIEAVVYESLRLYPPVPNLARRTTAADVLPSKVQLPRGTRCVINVAMIHRNADDWADPDSFRPERFLESDVPLHAFFPFGDGPYKCIGYRLALAEMILMLSILVVAFRFELPPGEKDSIKIKSAITLQPANPVRLNIFHR